MKKVTFVVVFVCLFFINIPGASLAMHEELSNVLGTLQTLLQKPPSLAELDANPRINPSELNEVKLNLLSELKGLESAIYVAPEFDSASFHKGDYGAVTSYLKDVRPALKAAKVSRETVLKELGECIRTLEQMLEYAAPFVSRAETAERLVDILLKVLSWDPDGNALGAAGEMVAIQDAYAHNCELKTLFDRRLENIQKK